MERESIITSPIFGATERELVPADACQFFYECSACGSLLRPRGRECCVFCWYGSTSCPQKQLERSVRPPQEA